MLALLYAKKPAKHFVELIKTLDDDGFESQFLKKIKPTDSLFAIDSNNGPWFSRTQIFKSLSCPVFNTRNQYSVHGKLSLGGVNICIRFSFKKNGHILLIYPNAY